MSPLSLWRFVTAAIALLVVLSAVVDADLIEARGTKSLSSATSSANAAAKTSTKHKSVKSSSTKAKSTKTKSTKAKSTSKAAKSTSKTSSKAAKSTKKATSATAKTKLSSAPTGAAKVVSSAHSDIFCASFVKQCFDSALSGQTGDVAVVHSCQRNGKKNSQSYSYSCKRDKKDLTKHVLNALAGDYTVYTTMGSTMVVSGTSTVLQTDYSTSTSTSLSTKATETSTSTATTTTSVDVTDVSTAATSTLTTVIPVTFTSAYEATATVTSLSTRTITTRVYLDQDEVPTYEVVVSDDSGARRRRAATGFCSTFGTACATECAKDGSKVQHSVCNAEKAPRYTLACVCKNGKPETQHALAAVVEENNIVSVTTLATSTSYVTATQTTTLPTAVVSVGTVTFTTTTPVTSTFTTLSTSTVATTLTEYTGLSVTVDTATSTSTRTTTQPATTTVYAATTTNIVLAATGYARGFSADDGSDLGLLSQDKNSLELTSFDQDASAILFMAVRDSDTGLYQLVQYGQPDVVVLSEKANTGDDYEAGSPAYSWMATGDPSVCGTSGTAAGPPAGDYYCETFVFAPLGLDETLGSDTKTVNLESTFINTNGGQYTGAWIYNQVSNFVYQVADPAAFYDAYQEQFTVFNLRFPYSS